MRSLDSELVLKVLPRSSDAGSGVFVISTVFDAVVPQKLLISVSDPSDPESPASCQMERAIRIVRSVGRRQLFPLSLPRTILWPC